MVVSDWATSPQDWREALDTLKAHIAPAFKRSEQRASAGAFINGLLSDVERKTGWMLSEEAGLSRPYRIQSLLGRSSWSADAVCEIVRRYSIETLGDPDGVLVVDETGFRKKGAHSVGVARQYTGTTGRTENSQIGVFASYASRWGHALVDRRLYLPKIWANDPERRRKANVPDDVAFATKPAIATEMVAKLLGEGLPCAFVLADAVYGSDARFRQMLEARGQAYVLAVRSNHPLQIFEDWPLTQTDPETMIASLPQNAWQALSASEGAKGPQLYDWACMPLEHASDTGFSRWVLARRSLRDPDKQTYYFVYARSEISLAEMAAAAGLYWTIDECFLRAKDDLGLDHCEARSWHGWHRHMSLVMAAAAFLVRLAAEQRRMAFSTPHSDRPNLGTVQTCRPVSRPGWP